MAATRIKVPQLANGIDGELITWDASGVPTTVAVGTSGHVLTSNGVGAAPTFQAVSDATTASNGLTKTSNDIALGGSLTGVTTITGDTTNYLIVTGARTAADAASLIVNNTGASGPALKTLASGTGAGVWGESTTGTGIYGSSGSISVGGYSTGTVGTLFTMEPASTNTIAQGMVLDRNTTGTATDGIGNKIFFRHETSTSANQSANSIVSKWSTATHASRLSEIYFTGYDIGVENTLLSLLGTGKATLNKYGIGTFTGTAAYTLQVDSSGNIIEGTIAGASGDVLIGGNSPAADMSIGTNNTFGLNLETNGTTRISMTNAGAINIGQAAAQRIVVSSTASSTSGGIELSSTSTTSGTDVGVLITGPAYTASSNDNKVVKVTGSYTRSSGVSGGVSMIAITPTVNFTGTAGGGTTAVEITPTLTSLTAAGAKFYGVYMNFSNAKAYGTYQQGASTLNIFEGKTAIGSTTDPTEMLNLTGNMVVAGQYASTTYTITDGAGFAVNWNNGNVQQVTIVNNRTPTFSNPKEGGRYILKIKQDGTGSRLITWSGMTVQWRGGTAPTLTTTANKADIITFIYMGGVYFGDASLNY